MSTYQRGSSCIHLRTRDCGAHPATAGSGSAPRDGLGSTAGSLRFGDTSLRPGRRMSSIEAIVDSLKKVLTPSARKRLKQALTMVTGCRGLDRRARHQPRERRRGTRSRRLGRTSIVRQAPAEAAHAPQAPGQVQALRAPEPCARVAIAAVAPMTYGRTSTTKPRFARLDSRCASQLVIWTQPLVSARPSRLGSGVP